MDQTHARALEALQPFIHLALSNSATSPRFVANLITNATSSPHTYVFAELLESPTIQSLSSPDTPAEYRGYLKLLEIFAWGTWQEYQATPNLPKLSSEQSLKLRLLSLLSLASTNTTLTYPALTKALSLPSTADLESLVTAAIYVPLITARLSPASHPPTVNVTAVAPLRDVPSQSLPKMTSVLTEWEARCGEVVTDLETEIARVKENAAKRHAEEQEYEALLSDAVKRRQAAANSNLDGATSGGSSRSGKPSSSRRMDSWRSAMGVGSNKREADDIAEDDGFFESGEGGAGSRMDIDEGAGSSRGGSTRHPKRVVGRKP
ncbi:COP9 signalosome complex subunit 7 [Penicillium capsulatum]|uniref:COP9 signalosome complex subunit 7 n=1 Tax=Penicillium capsulatum TaxID=69766 RepID=A0A9W9IR43_9EURO|nr:COP9 signalosome complex subunit 7 [Penicillium capsulatum]KAJ6129774.1 COP9 signalosome complex subunit 7 [Penicillium capsulatum]